MPDSPSATAGDDRVARILASLPAAVAVMRGPDHVFDACNEQYRALVGVDRDIVGLTVAQALPEVIGQGFIDLLDEVYRTGTPYIGREVEAHLDSGSAGRPERSFLDFAYVPMRDARGRVDGVVAHVVDVTNFVVARERASSLAEQRRAYEVNDTVLQRLAVADLALGLDRVDEAREAVRDALATAKQLIDAWGTHSEDLSLSSHHAAEEASSEGAGG